MIVCTSLNILKWQRYICVLNYNYALTGKMYYPDRYRCIKILTFFNVTDSGASITKTKEHHTVLWQQTRGQTTLYFPRICIRRRTI